MKITELLSDMFFPEGIKCIVCDGELSSDTRYGLCGKCKPEYNDRFCLYCGRPINNMAKYCDECMSVHFEFTAARAPFVYEGNAMKLVRGLKYGNKRWLAKYMAQFIADVYYETEWETDLITYVPMYSARLKERGYNQAELLAKALSGIVGIECGPTLVRINAVENLARLDREARAKEIEGEITLAEQSKLKGKRILLIDDVVTTGTTLNECARVLKKSGCDRIYALTFAAARKKPLLY